MLFELVGRGLTLTPSGLELLEQVREMGQAAGRVSLAAIDQSQSIEGNVSIAASQIYAALLLPPIIAMLRQLHPAIRVEVVADNQANDLRRREADIAIRNFRPTEPNLIARKLREVPARLYTKPDYLATIGNPTQPSDLSAADFINIDSSGGYLSALNGLGLTLTPDNFPILSENHLVMWEMVKQGQGIGILDGNIGDTEPLVRRALPIFEPLMFPIWLVAHREVNTSRRIRMVYDLLAAELTRP